MPFEFMAEGHTRGYYGSIVHNVKAVYQRYLSWYDGNPARLHPHPPVEAGKRYVDLAGGADALLAKAQAAFDDGDYRWVTELVNHLVFADPSNVAARQLQADGLEQLGYQAESSTFRNAYLTGAQELRNGKPDSREIRRRNLVEALTVDQVFDTIAIRLKAEELEGQRIFIDWTFPDLTDTDQPTEWMLGLENRVLHYTSGRHQTDAAVSVTLTKKTLSNIMMGRTTFGDEINAGTITISGDVEALLVIFGNLETFVSGFGLVEP